MTFNRRSLLALGVFVALAAMAGLGRWYETHRARPQANASSTLLVHVTNGSDRGPGTLREALFLVASSREPGRISIEVTTITLESALPAIVSGNGISLVAQAGSSLIDAEALPSGPVFDISGPGTLVQGINVRHCPAAAILVRSSHFHLTGSTVEDCEVGVEVAENAGGTLLEHNLLLKNRIGVRFAAAGRDSVIANNEFRENRDAGVWAVRSAFEERDDAIGIHDNMFRGNGIGIVAGNIGVRAERNDFVNAHEADVQIVGAGAVIRGNHLDGGEAMGIVAENARGAVISDNEIEGLTAYGVMLRGSSNTLVEKNRVHNCGYGLAFVLGDPRAVSSAVDNTIIEPKYNGIDVIGDSPVLRRNQVLRAHAYALHIENFTAAGRPTVQAQPFLDDNNFGGSPVSGGVNTAGQHK
ncbi:MAG TPA: right-handed parallel beta-helix repeat-containing protein [Steroidobacteraceae bacterium]|nr:right-handed parallel beta-helix repeat-containing protein [Steroidobacteraceae bacterium]